MTLLSGFKKTAMQKGIPLILGLFTLISAVSPVYGTETATPSPEPELLLEPAQSDRIPGWPAGPFVEAEAAAVMDLDSGTFLYSKNIEEKKYPASITKILTTLVALEHASLDEQVCFSRNAVFGIEPGSSHIGVREGEILTMEQCLYGILLESANEVCLGVAEHISGSVDAFMELMNHKAASLGCTGTHFVNPNGLHDEDHYTTAHDMALIAGAAYKNPEFRKICQTCTYTIPPTNRTAETRWLWHQHKMLPDRSFAYPGCTGGKTGFTDQSLNTMVTFAERENRRLVCVSLRTNGRQIYPDTAAMLDYGFNCFRNYSMKEASAPSGLFYPDRCFSSCYTLDELRPASMVTLPAEHEISELETACFHNRVFLGRTYLYHDYPVGYEFISHKDMDSFFQGPPELNDQKHGPLCKEGKVSHCDKGMFPSVLFFSLSGALVLLLGGVNLYLFIKRHPRKK